MGTALQEAVTQHGVEPLRRLWQHWRFFQALVADVEMVLAKSELEIGRRYTALAGAEHADLFALIEQEFALARRWILELKNAGELLDDQRTLQRNIRLRNPYVDPLHVKRNWRVETFRGCWQWQSLGRSSARWRSRGDSSTPAVPALP
jgi:phosphoenolpyruvate carboxylase